MSFEIQITALDHFEEITLKESNTANSIRICTKGGLLNEWLIDENRSIINGNDFSDGWGNFDQGA